MTGVAPFIPGLLGLPRDYILSQFGAWRNGERRAAAPDCMAEVAKRLAPGDVTAMATWLSSQPVTSGPAAPGSLPAKLPITCGSVPR
jgi:cytochrome c553